MNGGAGRFGPPLEREVIMQRYLSSGSPCATRAEAPTVEALLPAAGAGTALWLMLATLLFVV